MPEAPERAGTPGRVARILPFSAVDGPGNRAVVFLQGCNFDCHYCHNPETRRDCLGCGLCLAACPAAALEPAGRSPAPPLWLEQACRDCGTCLSACPHGSSPKVLFLEPGAVLARLRPYFPLIRGLTISGGECLLQPDFLAGLLEAARAEGKPGLVDSNGSIPLEGLPRVLAAAEGFMLDLKAWNAREHRELTGADNATVLTNLRLLARGAALAEVRTVILPGAFDVEETVREVAGVLAGSGSRALYRLLPYREAGVRPERAAGLREPDAALLARLAGLARAEGLGRVVIG